MNTTHVDGKRIARRKTIAGEVRALMGRGRAGKRVTQTELGDAVGLSHASVSGRLSGTTAFTTDELDLIAEFFGVPMSALVEPVGSGQNLKRMRSGTRPRDNRPTAHAAA